MQLSRALALSHPLELRVHVGSHFPLDVIGGAALGLAGGALSAWSSPSAITAPAGERTPLRLR